MNAIDWHRVTALTEAQDAPDATRNERREACYYLLCHGVHEPTTADWVGVTLKTLQRWRKEWGV